MIFTFTDFGVEGPYMGQIRTVLHVEAPGVPIVDLIVDAPAFDSRAAAYLLSAIIDPLPADSVSLCVVDPGVGSSRMPVIMRCNQRWYVGPENGLFEIVARRCESLVEWWEIIWRPKHLSASFHGRDLFAPVAGRLAVNGKDALGDLARPLAPGRGAYPDWPDDLAEVIYIDRYGNCMLGVRWRTLSKDQHVMLGPRTLPVARTFADVPSGEAFYYENAMGLVEVAVSGGNAAQLLDLKIGSQVAVR